MQETPGTRAPSLGWEDPLQEEMATRSSILAGKIPWTEEPGGLQSTGSQSNWTRLSPHRWTEGGGTEDPDAWVLEEKGTGSFLGGRQCLVSGPE